MKSYFYINSNGLQAGPITADKFIANGITKETNVWCKGLERWTKAGDVPELKPLLASIPPPIPYATQQTPNFQQTQTDVCPNNYLLVSVLTAIFCCLPAGIAAIVYSCKVNTAWVQGNKVDAQKNSENAKMWSLISAAFGAVCGMLCVVFLLLERLESVK